MNYLLGFLVALMTLMGSLAHAANPQTAGQVKLELLTQLERDGYLSNKLATEAKEKYVDPQELALPLAQGSPKAEDSLWDQYASWTNFFKVVGVVCLLVAFGSTIARFATWAMFVIVMVPKEVYQTVFLAASLTMTLVPQVLWASQAFYLALFGAFANVLLLGWVVESHPKLAKFLANIFKLGIPPACIASFWGMLYFGALALAYQSQIFGFFAAVCLSGIFSFAIVYRPGVLTLFFHEKGTPAVVFGHLVVLVGYAGLKIAGVLPTQTSLFQAGLEYYGTIAMGVGFLVGASPFGRDKAVGGYLALFLVVLLAAVTGYFFYDLKVIGSILVCIAILLALEWLGYLSHKAGFILGAFLAGTSLYGGALLLERYAHLLVLKLA